MRLNSILRLAPLQSRCNKLIGEQGKATVIEAVAARPVDDGSDPDASAGNQFSIDDFVKPFDWLEEKNWGTLSIDASSTPVDITTPSDLKLLNEARETTERIIDQPMMRGMAGTAVEHCAKISISVRNGFRSDDTSRYCETNAKFQVLSKTERVGFEPTRV